MSAQSIIIILFIIIVIGIISSALIFNDEARVRRALSKHRRKPISQVRTGEIAKIIGQAKSEKDTLTAPLSGRKCVRYEVVVEKKGNKNSWTTIIDDSDQIDYYIEDETGKALIQLNDHIIHLVEDKEYNSGLLNDATEHLEEYLTSHGVKSEYWLGINKTLRYKEAIIAVNERIAVLGEGNWIKSENDKKLLEIIESAQTRVYLTDDPKLF